MNANEPLQISLSQRILRSMTDEGRILETGGSIDAERRWALRERADRRFDYAEYRYVDLGPDGAVEGYWTQSYTSDLFETAQEARSNALDAISCCPVSCSTEASRPAFHLFRTIAHPVPAAERPLHEARLPQAGAA